MTSAVERIMKMPLKADNAFVRGVTDSYHVATISSGMNDREEYARLFAAAPALLGALCDLSEVVSDLRHSGDIREGLATKRLNEVLPRAFDIIEVTIRT